MLIGRFLDGLAGSAFLSVAGGTVGDMYAKHVSANIVHTNSLQLANLDAGAVGTHDGVGTTHRNQDESIADQTAGTQPAHSSVQRLDHSSVASLSRILHGDGKFVVPPHPSCIMTLYLEGA